MSESIKLSEFKESSRVLVNKKQKQWGRTDTVSRRSQWQVLLEDIVNVNYNNRGEIFQFLLDKLNKHKSYFFCGFDLFYLNNFNTNLIDSSLQVNLGLSNVESQKNQIGRAIRWLAKPHAVKPSHANIFNFVSFLLKNNSIAKKRQVVVIQGEKASGKGTQMTSVLEFFKYLGKTEFLRQNTLDPDQVWDVSDQARSVRKNSEKKSTCLEVPTAKRSRAISQNKKPKILSKLREETMRVNVMNMKASVQEEKRFASEESVNLLVKGLRTLELFVNTINPLNRRTSNATVVMKVKIDEQEDGCLIRRGFFQVNFFLSQTLENKWLGGFESLYAFLGEADETFLNAYGIQKKMQANPGLYNDSFLKTHISKLAKNWREMEEFVPAKLMRQIQKAMCATLILVNVNSQSVAKELNYLAILLDISKSKLESYFKLPQEDLTPRHKIRFLKKKGRNAAIVLYRAIVDMVVAFFNIQMFEVFRVSCSGSEMESKDQFDLEFIDFLGYIDNTHEAKSRSSKFKKENGSYEFITNWLNEKLYNLYTKHKFSSPRKNDTEIKFVRNDDILAKMERLLATLQQHEDYARAAEEVGQDHLVFLKKAMNFLGQSGLRSTSLDEEGHYLDFTHFFTESMNYDLRSLHELTRPQSRDVEFFWTQVLSESTGLLLPVNWALDEVLISQYVILKWEETAQSAEWKQLAVNYVVEHQVLTDSDFEDVQAEWGAFISEFEDTDDIYFINCLRIDKVANPKDIEEELYKTFNGIDFESLIDFYQSNYPVRFSYDYFYKKFGLESTVVNLLGARVNFDDVNELKSITKQMLGLVLPKTGNYILDEDFLYIKHDFFEQIETQLKRLRGHKTIKKIIEEMLIMALRSKIKAQYKGGFTLAKHFILRHSRVHTMDLVRQAAAKFKKPLAQFRQKKEEEYLSQRYASMASRVLTDFAKEEEVEQVIVIQKIWKGLKARRQFREALEQKKQKEEQRNQLQELQAKMEALAVLRSNAKQKYMFDFLQIRRRMLLKIQIFLRRKLFKMELNNRILKKQKQRLVKKMKKAEKLVVQNLHDHIQHKCRLKHPGHMQPNDVLNCPIIFPIMRTQSVRERQLVLRAALMNFHLTKPQELPMGFQENLSSVLNEIAREGDMVLSLNVLSEVSLVQTVRKKVHVFANYEDRRHIIVSLPFKSHCVSYFNEFLYIIDEGFRLRLKYIPFADQAPDETFRPTRTILISEDEEREAMFVFAKFRDMVLKNKSFVGVTDCDKLCVKDDLSDEFTEAKIIQFKRKITRLGCGKRFFIVLDESGVLYAGGDNSRGQLGLGHTDPVSEIQPVKSLSYQKAIIKSFSCGKSHTLAVTSNNQIFAWGCNRHGQVNPEFRDKTKMLIEVVDRPIRILQTMDFVFKGLHKLQIKAGKLSSYVLTSAGTLFFFGTCASHKSPRKMMKWALPQIFGKDFWPVSLSVEWNSRIELAYVRFVDGNAMGVRGKSKLKQVHRDLFINFMLSPSGLIHFSPKFANQLDPAFLSNKVTQLTNQRHHQILQKEKERTWNFMMFSSKLK